MSMYRKIGLPCALALSIAACGSNTSTDDAGTITPGIDSGTPAVDSGTTKTDAAPAVKTYTWVVVQDTEQKACTTNGPGADIDAVAKLDATGNFAGWGLKKSAHFTPNALGNACDNVDCSGGNCKYAAISKTFTEADLVARTEGPADAQINKADDVGYFSLNAGTLQIQIGDINGLGTAQNLKSGDFIAVYEVDQSYIGSGDALTCSCLPEHYTVTLENDAKETLPLIPVRLLDSNKTCSALTAISTEGCGTTTFQVP